MLSRLLVGATRRRWHDQAKRNTDLTWIITGHRRSARLSVVSGQQQVSIIDHIPVTPKHVRLYVLMPSRGDDVHLIKCSSCVRAAMIKRPGAGKIN